VRRTIQRSFAAVTGPRGRWAALGVWILLGIGGYVAHAHLGDVTAAGQASFLPSHSESTRAVAALQRG
jgi:hypothetical protein